VPQPLAQLGELPCGHPPNDGPAQASNAAQRLWSKT